MRKALLACLIVGFFVSEPYAACQKFRTVNLMEWVKGSGSDYVYYVVNTSDENITVSIKLYDSDGNLYTESTESGANLNYNGFSNNPIDSGGGVLEPKHTGRLIFLRSGGIRYGYAELTWESDECLDSLLLVSGRYSTSCQYSWFRLHGGNGI